jgi:probable HAF family extracellular repeat protein
VSQLRTAFAHSVRSPHRPVAQACRDFGISRQTGYVWLRRFDAQPGAELADRSRRPRLSPGKTDHVASTAIPVQGTPANPTSVVMRHTTRSVRPVAGCSLFVIALLTSAAPADPPRFAITELPTLGGVGSRGVAVNRSGLVCGESNRPNEGYMVATAWLPPDHQPVYLTGSGGSVATGSSVNELGVIVGYSDTLGNAYRAAPPGVAPAIIGEMGTHAGLAACITEHGDICGGWTGQGAEGSHPFMIRAGVFSALPLLQGGTQGAASGINESGLVVGWSEQGPNGGFTRAAKWENGVVSALAGGESLNAAISVNDEGWIVGYTSDPSSPPTTATLWIDPQNPIDLGALVPSHWQHMAYAINNHRQIVGTSGVRAFVWEDGVMHDLATMIPADSGWLLYAANGISADPRLSPDAALPRGLRPLRGPRLAGLLRLPRRLLRKRSQGRFQRGWLGQLAGLLRLSRGVLRRLLI